MYPVSVPFLNGEVKRSKCRVQSTGLCLSLCYTDVLVKESDVQFLVCLIGTKAYKWKTMLGQCGLLPSEIASIERMRFHDHSEFLTEGLAVWYKTSRGDGLGHSKDPTLGVLDDALCSSVVSESTLADEIMKKWRNLSSVELQCNVHGCKT